jgi:hypothetical protein
MWSYYDWVYCCCRPSVNTICGRIMIWLSLLSSVSNCVYWRTTTTINPIIIRPHIVFTDGRQGRQPNHNTTTYCVYWRTTTTINPIILRPHILFTGRCFRSSVNKTQYVVVLWLGCRCCPSVNTICGRIMIDNNNKPNHNTTTYCVYWRTTTTINPIITRPHIVFIDGRQQQ